MKSKLFTYAILWHPTDKEIKDDGKKSKILVEPTNILAIDEKAAAMAAMMKIPKEYENQLDQLDVVVKAF